MQKNWWWTGDVLSHNPHLTYPSLKSSKWNNSSKNYNGREFVHTKICLVTDWPARSSYSKFKLVWHKFITVQFAWHQLVWKVCSVQFGAPGQVPPLSSFSSQTLPALSGICMRVCHSRYFFQSAWCPRDFIVLILCGNKMTSVVFHSPLSAEQKRSQLTPLTPIMKPKINFLLDI